MSKRNIFAIALLGAAMFAGTAAADGKTKRIYKPGPAPLNTSCPSGYYMDKDRRCVRPTTPTNCSPGFKRTAQGLCVRTTQAPRPSTTCPSGYARNSQGDCIRLTQSRPIPRPAPRPAPMPAPRPAPRPAPQQASLDLSAFNGGVGAGVSGGFYGGNGFVALAPQRNFSGALDSAASVFTFNRRMQSAPKGPRPGGPKPCNMGCGGGGGHGPKGGGHHGPKGGGHGPKRGHK